MRPIAMVAAMVAFGAAAGAQVSLPVTGGVRTLAVGGKGVVALSTPWLASADWKTIRQFPTAPIAGEGKHTAQDKFAAGTWTESATLSGDEVTLRYEYDLAGAPDGSHVQWYWRLEPSLFDGAIVEGRAAAPFGPRSIADTAVEGLSSLRISLAQEDLAIKCSTSQGAWRLLDVRSQDWARCYRFEVNVDFLHGSARTGWFEVTVKAATTPSAFVTLTGGHQLVALGIPFGTDGRVASAPGAAQRLYLLQTATGPAAAGDEVGRVVITYADGQKATVPARWGRQVVALSDDPRNLPDGALAWLSDGSPVWVSAWRNPRPDVAIAGVSADGARAGWRLVGVSAVRPGLEEGRLAMMEHGLAAATPAEETVLSLDGTWRLQPEDGKEREVTVPGMWERLPGLADAHTAVYRRTFDVPAALSGQRLALRFDAVGDAADVRVNGQSAGGHVGAALPFEVDVTALVKAPSTGNQLEVTVRDDTHFSADVRPGDWRGRRSWMPRGMGANSRKGLYQSVALVARPHVCIENVRVRTSVRKRQLAVAYELLNDGSATVRGVLGGDVAPASGGAAVLKLPATAVELPGQAHTTVTVTVPFGQTVQLWQPDHPTLYVLRSLLNDDKSARIERVDTRFGFREVWFEGANFYLNGIRCNLRGESPAYSEKTDMFATREAALEMIRRFQKANFTVLRFHSIPAPPHVLDVCDELGMMVIDESAIYASWQMLMPEHPDWMANCREHLTRWVRRDRNHPSVVLWSAENEGLNVGALTPALLADYARTIAENDGTRPVTFDGDGTGFGASPASNKHYVSTISDLEQRGGKSSGYGHDLRNDIYWATAYKQDVPLGCGEFLFPYEAPMRDKQREATYMMGLQTRGYRLADWYDIRPYNPSNSGFLRREGVLPGYEEAYDVIVKSFAPIAVFDKEYDALGPYPAPPKLKAGQPVRRTLIVYNDAFSDERVEVEWAAAQGAKRVAGDAKQLTIPLGGHTLVEIAFTPTTAGPLDLTLVSKKAGKETFRDAKRFVVQ